MITWILITAVLSIQMGLMIAPHIGDALFTRGKFRQALPWYRWQYGVSRLVPSWRASSALRLCTCYVYLGDARAALPYAEEAMQEATAPGQETYLATARAYLGLIWLSLGDAKFALEQFDLALADKRLDSYLRLWVKRYAIREYMDQDRLDDVERAARFVLYKVAEGSNECILMHCYLSSCYYQQERLEDALKEAQRAAQYPAQEEWLQIIVQRLSLYILAESGEIAEAQAFKALLQPRLATARKEERNAILDAFSVLALRAGEPEQALIYAREAVAAESTPNTEADLVLIEAEVALDCGETERAVALCQKVLQMECRQSRKRRAQRFLERLSVETPSDSETSAPDTA